MEATASLSHAICISAESSAHVLLLANPADLHGDAAAMFKDMPVTAVSATNEDQFQSDNVRSLFEADLLVDAILGTGFKPPVAGLYADAIQRMNAAPGRVVSVDIPSGADADSTGPQPGTLASADSVVTFASSHAPHTFSVP